AFIYIKKRQAILIDIVVYHLFRNKGIGSKLIKYIINELKGSDIICIKGEIKNKSVISFYLKLGFKYNEHGYVYKTLRDN
ncbi:GNAT family N-acetyltransferase, partial [Priestia sp. JSM ZJ58]